MAQAEAVTPPAVPPPGIVASDLDPYSLADILDPYPLHAALRDLAPVVWLRRYGTCVVSRYEDVNALLLDPVNFISSGGVGMSDIRKPGAWRTTSPIAEVDLPAHTAIRRTMNRIVAPDLIRGWRGKFTELAVRLCEEAAQAGEIEAVTSLIEPYVQIAFGDSLGVDLNRDNLTIIGNHGFNSSGPRNEIFYASLARAEKAADWFVHNTRREGMRPGGFGEKVFAAEDAGELPPGSATPMLGTLIRGGMDTTISMVGSLLRLLAEQPQWWQAAKQDRSLIAPMVEEILRLEAPSQTIYRTAARDIEFGGVTIPMDMKIQVLLAAANRDPRQWGNDADAFRPGRQGTSHAAFGLGPHFCLGRNIARLEAECLFNAIFDRFERIELAGEPRHRPLNGLRTLDVLRLRVR